MPPKTKITREMILDAAFELTRENGIEGVNARAIAKKLECSTQPVMYLFSTIEELKKALYHTVDGYHSQYLMNLSEASDGIMLGIGVNYIRFGIEEPNLFRFLFQSGYASENSLIEMIDSEELVPVIAAMQEAIGMTTQQTKDVFLIIAVFAHGYASIIANNSLEYDEALVTAHLSRAYYGAILAVKNEENEGNRE